MINTLPSPEQIKAISKLLTLCHIHTYPAKTTIIRPGDKGDTLHYIILSKGQSVLVLKTKMATNLSLPI